MPPGDMVTIWDLADKALKASDAWKIPPQGFAVSPYGFPTLPILPTGDENGAKRLPLGMNIEYASHPVLWLPRKVRALRPKETIPHYNIRLHFELFYRGYYVDFDKFTAADFFEAHFGSSLSEDSSLYSRVANYIQGGTNDTAINQAVTQEGALQNKAAVKDMEERVEALYQDMESTWLTHCELYDTIHKDRLQKAIVRSTHPDVLRPLLDPLKAKVEEIIASPNPSALKQEYLDLAAPIKYLIGLGIDDKGIMELATYSEDYLDDREFHKINYDQETREAGAYITAIENRSFAEDITLLRTAVEYHVLLVQKNQVACIESMNQPSFNTTSAYERWNRQIENRMWLRDSQGSAFPVRT